MIDVMTRQFTVQVIIGSRTVITPVMHHNELQETYIRVLSVMLEIMRDQLRRPEQLAHFSITNEVNTNQEYNQGLSHVNCLNIQKWCHVYCNKSHQNFIVCQA